MRLAVLIRRLAEAYGYTPEEVGDMPIKLIALLVSNEQDCEVAINRIGNRTTMTIEEWNKKVEGRKHV